MKLKHFILILSFILSVPSLAQAGGIKISGGTKGKGFDPAQVQAILTRRLEASYRQAREAQLRTRPTFPTEGPRKGELIKPAAFPTREITPHLNFRDPSQVYPDVPFLTTSQQVETYLISKSNRAIPQELEHLADHAQKVANHMITFFQEAFLCEQPVQQIPWLINRIPSNVNYFFLGEMHGYLEVRYAMAQFLRGLKQRFPEKNFLVLAEGVPAYISTDELLEALRAQPTQRDREELLQEFENIGQQTLAGIWETLHELEIPIVGLEPEFVFENPEAILLPQEAQDTENFYLWWSDQGSFVRHNYWAQRFQTWYQKDPNTLFIFIGGAAHFSRFRSQAFSNLFPRDQQLVINFFPRKWNMPDGQNNFIESEDNMSWFAEITQNQFPQHTLYWQTRESADLSGFDYQLKVPPLP